MPSTFFGLNIARSGMSTYNVWLNTTAHNISNVKTVGYTRQTVNQSASKPISFGTRYGMVGSGTEALDIVSERDVYYDAKYRLSNSDFGKYETFSYYMKELKILFMSRTVRQVVLPMRWIIFSNLLHPLQLGRLIPQSGQRRLVMPIC